MLIFSLIAVLGSSYKKYANLWFTAVFWLQPLTACIIAACLNFYYQEYLCTICSLKMLIVFQCGIQSG